MAHRISFDMVATDMKWRMARMIAREHGKNAPALKIITTMMVHHLHCLRDGTVKIAITVEVGNEHIELFARDFESVHDALIDRNIIDAINDAEESIYTKLLMLG